MTLPGTLDDRLPPDVVVGGSTPWSRYRQFPVFSRRWLAGRTLLFAACIGPFALVSGLGVGFASRNYGDGTRVALYTFVAFMAMATAGPALAACVRHLHWPLRRERAGIVLAVLLGIVASFFADRWASAYIESRLRPVGAFDAAPAANHDPKRPPNIDAVRARMQAAPPLERAAALTVNVVALLVVYGLFGGGLAMRAYFGEQRRREESEHRRQLERALETQRNAELRLGVLQAQVEPHFLFNTLAVVRALVRDRPAQAEQTLDALVAYLRASIPRLRDDSHALDSTLGDQVELCTHYLDVMRLRTDGRLTYAVDIAPALRRAPFPPLLLITLVENAVKHGLEPKRGAGHVLLRAGCDAGRLQVDVLDDGVGLSPGVHRAGLGLDNVRGQLRARYDGRATFALQGQPGGGTLARIDLPMDCP